MILLVNGPMLVITATTHDPGPVGPAVVRADAWRTVDARPVGHGLAQAEHPAER
jgi:hypothetical protein